MTNFGYISIINFNIPQRPEYSLKRQLRLVTGTVGTVGCSFTAFYLNMPISCVAIYVCVGGGWQCKMLKLGTVNKMEGKKR